MAATDARTLQRRLGLAQESLLVKKERLEEAEQCHQEDQQTFTMFNQELQDKWELRFNRLAAAAKAAGVSPEDIEAIRLDRPPDSVLDVEARASHAAPSAAAAAP